MSTEKSYAQIAFEEVRPGANWQYCDLKSYWEDCAQAVIAEYERREGAAKDYQDELTEQDMTIKELRKQVAYLTKQLEYRAEKLPSVEIIAETIYDCLELVTTRGNVLTAAQAVLDLLQAKRVDIPQTREEELQADLDERRAKDVDSILKKLDNENQGESEEQYQSRLLRALRASR